ncbi:DHA2 family efflux MFS transporter permease subunit [Streptomyces sp. NPDC021622]|uniref:DHA2 family efflux MFS transporter permease subunit n=1 Tax=Streptomyces sp. NPDC021622 TaxID=3155013 RepID=UPI0033E4423A
MTPDSAPPEDRSAGKGTKGTVGWAVLVTGVASFMAGLDNLVIVTALPTIREELGGSLQDLEWTVNAYTLSFAVLMMLGAAVGDRFGRRKIFVVGLLLFTGASAAAAVAPGINELVAARAVQGAGAALIMPLSLTLLTAAVPAEKRGAMLGIYGAINGLSIAGGPLAGGLIVEHLSWQWIFWVNVPVGLVFAPFALRKLAESRGPAARLDVTGTVLVSVALFGIVLGLVEGNSSGWTSPLVLGGLVGGAAVLVGFVVWELRSREPMLPMGMFRNRAFSAINAGGILMAVGMFGTIFLVTQFMQNVQGFGPLEAGVRMLAWTAMPVLVAPFAGIVSDRTGGRPVVVLGLILMTIGLAWFALLLEPDTGFAAQLPAFMLCGAGMACFYAPLMNLTMSTVRVEEHGIASGATAATREVGAALGVALLASVFSANGGYASRQHFVDGLIPALWVASAALALAAVAMLFTPKGAATPQPQAAGGPAAKTQGDAVLADG